MILDIRSGKPISTEMHHTENVAECCAAIGLHNFIEWGSIEEQETSTHYILDYNKDADTDYLRVEGEITFNIVGDVLSVTHYCTIEREG